MGESLPHFALRLRELRTAAKMTQDELAERAGMHRLSITQLETGRREPSLKTAQHLAAALGVQLNAFTDPAIMPAPPRPRGRPRKRPGTD